MTAVRGRSSDLPGLRFCPGFQPAYSCHLCLNTTVAALNPIRSTLDDETAPHHHPRRRYLWPLRRRQYRPLRQALEQVSALLYCAKKLALDAAVGKDSQRHAWASYYLCEMGKAVIDDVCLREF